MKLKLSNEVRIDTPPGKNGANNGNGQKTFTSTLTTTASKIPASELDVLCLSHLRWDFVYQRPQHLLGRRAKHARVFYFEEPYFDSPDDAHLEVTVTSEGVVRAVPHVPAGTTPAEVAILQRELLDEFMRAQQINNFILWYYTPMALSFTAHLEPQAVVYDCMDELSAFKGAPPELKIRESKLFRMADLVFTGGQSLYEAKRDKHPSVHLFPSSIDAAHFKNARVMQPDPTDQVGIPHPRLGFFGVLDERFDRALLHDAALARPDWHFVMVGPVVKIDPKDLPKAPNIHYLGSKQYRELPAYIAGWDVALLLFARNESTRYISPTKTPEYLAAGKPVVSTSIRDVVRPYGELGLVRIADAPEEFIGAVEQSMAGVEDSEWLARVDRFLRKSSWDLTVQRMFALVAEVATPNLETEISVQQDTAAA
ncbi:MAG: hypothetical protein JWO13_2421 [Acidobacteriales bacterium]|nr:hypothetical protein [Terriglobales bacterium]